MSYKNQQSENALEEAVVKLFKSLGYDSADLMHETFGEEASHGRKTSTEVIFTSRLKAKLIEFNPDIPEQALNAAIEELARDRSAMNPVYANQKVYKLLKDGIQVDWKNEHGEEESDIAKVIDWEQSENNDFFLAQQMWISGELYNKRCDLVGCVNGIPLIFIELKKPAVNVKHAYDDNLKDYQNNTIPQLWWYNAFIILSNGSESRLGSTTAQWEHFVEWKKISDENEKGIISLETMVRGTCEKKKLIEFIENFIIYSEVKGGLAKIIAKNHQFLGVGNAVKAVTQMPENKGRLGVFWHTQGSGKSFSMVFFCQYIQRKIPGNWTFLIVTDRTELDKQIYKTFANSGLINEKQCQAESGNHLQQLLKEDHKFVFSLIQKFQTNDGSEYPKLSDRSDIIVITDEAHRSQYDTLAMNMRRALPNAAFIGFTGTPLISGEERTREVFGEYVSIYNFKQSVEDGATVPLYYENRIPELQLINDTLNDDVYEIVESANLDEEQEKKLEKYLGREYHLITRDERLETIAEDIVKHFIGRGNLGKGMVISIDRFTAVKMYDKVKKYWDKNLHKLINRKHSGEKGLDELISFMKETDMAVIISTSQNEQAYFAAKGLDILTHRKRIKRDDLETKFKNSEDPLRIVFVCAMWLTGFDVPSCNTIYLDKPMKNHTLMQTIARANRVFPDKNNGLIVDYAGIFRNLQKALAIYGSGSGGGVDEGDTPVENKIELVKMLATQAEEIKNFCCQNEIDIQNILESQGFQRIALIDDAVDKLVFPEDTQKKFLSKVALFIRIHKAVMPDPIAHEFDALKSLIKTIESKLKPDDKVDISKVVKDIDELLDRSISTEGYVINKSLKTVNLGDNQSPYNENKLIDLSKIDFDALSEYFHKSKKRTIIEKLKTAIDAKLKELIELNKTRMDYLDKFTHMIDEYNNGSRNIEEFFKLLTSFVDELNHEDKRGIREGLSEEELVIFDLLTKPEIDLTEKEKKDVKKVGKQLLERLKQEKLVLDWRKRQQTRAAVLLCVEETLDKLPTAYGNDIWQTKCQNVYQHIFDNHKDANHNI